MSSDKNQENLQPVKTPDRMFTFDELKEAWRGGVKFGKARENASEGVELSCPDFYSWYHLTFEK